jgi:peptidoglycan/xylan/chitin deacetylase (PgdA/CDA1 family)
VSVLVLTYHAVEPGPAPLCVAPDLFRAHLDVIVESGVPAFTVSQLAERLRGRTLPKRAVVVTFDDAAASVVQTAAPMLADRGLPGTVFCVAGHLGGRSDWPSRRRRTPLFDLATADELAATELEIGSHGFTHDPLRNGDAEHEVVESRRELERILGRPVGTFAYPYTAVRAHELVRRTYTAACAGGNAEVEPDSDPWAMPRVDIHYLRRPALLRRALDGSLDTYLVVRRVVARARRLLLSDYGPSGS